MFFFGTFEAMARDFGLQADQLFALLRGPQPSTGTVRRRSGSLSDDARAALLAPEASTSLSRFSTRGASIRAFWSTQLAREVDRARQLARDIEAGVFLRPAPPSNHAQVFSLLLRLFAHENCLDELTSLFKRDSQVSSL